MKQISDEIHLDPSMDLSEAHGEVFNFLAGVWGQVGLMKALNVHDEFVFALMGDLESRLVAMGLVLKFNSEMMHRRC